MSELRMVRVTAPGTQPVTLAEAKLHARIDEDTDNAEVTRLIETATELAESYCSRAFITQTWKRFLDAWPTCGFVEMPKAPLQSVTHIKTYDDADVATEFNGAYYFVDTATRPGRITIRTTGNWPSGARVANSIEIQFVCGYGANGDAVPSKIKNAILDMVAFLYENRGVTATIPDAIYAQLDGERTWFV